VPVQTVIGTISMGANRKCFVVGADGQPELRDIVVGMSNQRLVEVKSGLKDGEKVVLNPMPLLPDDGEMKPGKVRTKTDDDGQDSGGDGKKSGKKSKKKGNGTGLETPKGPFSPGAAP